MKILDYNSSTKKFLVKILFNKKNLIKEVNRFSIIFRDESLDNWI